jgi:hypothetical protein
MKTALSHLVILCAALTTLTPLSCQAADGIESLAAPMKIAVTPKSTTERDYRQAVLEWSKRMMIEPFHETLKGSAWDEFAEPFVEGAVAAWIAADENGDHEELLKSGKKALELGCDDPLVRFLWAHLEFKRTKNWRDPVWENLDKALKRLPQSQYPKAVWVGVAYQFRTVLLSGSHSTKEIDAQIVQWSREALAEGNYTPEEQTILVRQMMSEERPFIDGLREVVESSTLEEWAKKALIGFAEVKTAWKERGSGWAAEVTSKGWDEFGKHLEKARVALTEAWKLRPDQPQAAAAMITVTMGGGGDEGDSLQTWFERSVAAQFDYRPAYSALRTALRPRWGGSHEAAMAFGRACLATQRYDTYVPLEYMNVLSDIINDTNDWRGIFRQPQIAREIAALNQALLQEPTRAGEQTLRYEHIALDGWLTGDYESSRNALKKIHGPWHAVPKRKMRVYAIDEQTLRSDAEIYNSPAREDFARAEKLYDAGQSRQAQEFYEAAAAKSADPAHPPFGIRRRLAAIKFEKELETGNWVALTPSLETWRTRGGTWSIGSDGAIVNQGTDNEGIILAPGQVGPNFEIRGEFEITAPGECCRNFGVIIGYREDAPQHWITFHTWQNGTSAQKALIVDEFRNRSKAKPLDLQLGAKNQFLVQSWQGKLAYYLNSAPIQTEYPADSVDWRQEVIGFGSSRFCQENTTATRKIEVRRLTSAPVPPEVPPPAAK